MESKQNKYLHKQVKNIVKNMGDITKGVKLDEL